jgi:hypothetical protein
MAIREINTGIFTQETISNLTKLERRQLRERALALRNIKKRLDGIETAAKEVLAAAGMRFFPGGGESKISEETWRKKHELGDAMEILNYIGMLRDAMKDGKIEEAVIHALNLGQVSTRLYVRPHEKAAKAGRPSLKNLEKGRSATGRYEAARRRNIQWVKYFKKLNPRLSVMNRCSLVAKYFSSPLQRSEKEEKSVTAAAVKKAIQKYLKK